MKSSDPNADGKNYSTFLIKPYKYTELANIYGINVQTLKKWIAGLRDQIGEVVGHYLNISQVEIIIAHLRLPYYVKVEVEGEEDFEKTLDRKMERLPEKSKKTKLESLTNSKKQNKPGHKPKNKTKRKK